MQFFKSGSCLLMLFFNLFTENILLILIMLGISGGWVAVGQMRLARPILFVRNINFEFIFD